jgi:DNA polymerase-3 subunit alpha
MWISRTSNAHDILLCVNTGDMQSTPIATDEEGGRAIVLVSLMISFILKHRQKWVSCFMTCPNH